MHRFRGYGRLVFALALPLVLGFFASLANAATVYIEEYGQFRLPVYWQAAQTPGLAKQTVAISGSSTQSAAFGQFTVLIRVHADSICSIEIGGTNPTATATSARFIAGQTEYFLVNAGDKLAVITNN